MNCRCGVPVDAPFHLCPSHAPAHRATAHKSYMVHRAAVLARQRARNARPPVANEPCLECSGPVPEYTGRNRVRLYCSTVCRQRHDDRNRSPRHRTRKDPEMPTRSELEDAAELAEVLKIATRAADAWRRGKDDGDEHLQLDAAKLFDLARMRLRRLTGRTVESAVR